MWRRCRSYGEGSMVVELMMVVVQKVVQKVVRNLFFEGFRTILFCLWYDIGFRYHIVFVPGSYVGFYARGVLWSARGDDGGKHVTMGPVRVTGFGQFWSDFRET